MKQNGLILFCCLVGAGLMLTSPVPGFGQDARFRTFALPESGLHMEISFNGTAKAGDDRPLRLDFQRSPVPGFQDHLFRMQAYLLKYVTIGSAQDPADVKSPDPPVAEHPLSLTFQAGLKDKSGALFLVMQL